MGNTESYPVGRLKETAEETGCRLVVIESAWVVLVEEGWRRESVRLPRNGFCELREMKGDEIRCDELIDVLNSGNCKCILEREWALAAIVEGWRRLHRVWGWLWIGLLTSAFLTENDTIRHRYFWYRPGLILGFDFWLPLNRYLWALGWLDDLDPGCSSCWIVNQAHIFSFFLFSLNSLFVFRFWCITKIYILQLNVLHIRSMVLFSKKYTSFVSYRWHNWIFDTTHKLVWFP